MTILIWYKLFLEKIFLILDWIRCLNNSLTNGSTDAEDGFFYLSKDYTFAMLIFQAETVLYDVAFTVFNDKHYLLIISIQDFVDYLFFFNSRVFDDFKRRYWYQEVFLIHSYATQFNIIGQILNFAQTKKMFTDIWGGGHMGYINLKGSPVFFHHISQYDYSFKDYNKRIYLYLEQRFDFLWQLWSTSYDDIVFLDFSYLFSTKKIFLKFLKKFLKFVPNEKRIMVTPYIKPGYSFNESVFIHKKIKIPTIQDLVTWFHPIRTFVNSDIVHPDSFAVIKFWYYAWATVLFSLDDEILKKKFFPYSIGTTDCTNLNCHIINNYYEGSVKKKRRWTRPRNLYKRIGSEIIKKSFKLNGVFMWHIVWYDDKWSLLKKEHSYSFEE